MSAWLACVGVVLNDKASAQVSFQEFDRVTRASFGAWNQVRCGGRMPSILFTMLGKLSCAAQEFNDEKGNANIVLFRDGEWPYEGQSSVLALTTLTFGADSGIIYDADLEIKADPGAVRLTTSDSGVDTDLQSILTHEAGHMLGLAHSKVEGATMQATYPPRSINFRSLEEDDLAGLCAAYPPDRAGLPTCDPSGPSLRSLGLSRQCGGADLVPDDDSSCGCRAVAASTSAGVPGGGLLVVASVLALGHRSRRRASR